MLWYFTLRVLACHFLLSVCGAHQLFRWAALCDGLSIIAIITLRRITTSFQNLLNNLVLAVICFCAMFGWDLAAQLWNLPTETSHVSLTLP